MNRRSFILTTAAAAVAIPGWSNNQSKADIPREPASELEDLITRAINEALYVQGVMDTEKMTFPHSGAVIGFTVPIHGNEATAKTLTIITASYIARNDARIQLVDAGTLATDLKGRIFCSQEYCYSSKLTGASIDPTPLRYNEWPEFLEPEINSSDSYSYMNPDWMRAENEVALGIEGVPFLRLGDVKCRKVDDDSGHYYVCHITREWTRLSGKILIKQIKRQNHHNHA